MAEALKVARAAKEAFLGGFFAAGFFACANFAHGLSLPVGSTVAAGAPALTRRFPCLLRLTPPLTEAVMRTSASWAAAVADRVAGATDSTHASWAAASDGVGEAIAALGRCAEGAAGRDGGICGSGNYAGRRSEENLFAPRPRNDEDLPLYRLSEPLFHGLGACVYRSLKLFYGFG